MRDTHARCEDWGLVGSSLTTRVVDWKLVMVGVFNHRSLHGWSLFKRSLVDRGLLHCKVVVLLMGHIVLTGVVVEGTRGGQDDVLAVL